MFTYIQGGLPNMSHQGTIPFPVGMKKCEARYLISTLNVLTIIVHDQTTCTDMTCASEVYQTAGYHSRKLTRKRTIECVF